MKWLRRFSGLLVLLLSAGVFAGCVASVAGVWYLRYDLPQRVGAAAGQLDNGLGKLNSASDHVRRAAGTIRADVQLVLDDRTNLEPGEERNRLVAAYLRTVAQRLRLVAEAAATATTAVRNIASLPSGRGSVDDSAVDRSARHAANIDATAEKLQHRLGPDDRALTGDQLVEAANDVLVGLNQCDELAADVGPALESARDPLSGLSDWLRRWITVTAVVVTAAAAWLALGQVSLAAWGWRRWRGRDTTAA